MNTPRPAECRSIVQLILGLGIAAVLTACGTITPSAPVVDPVKPVATAPSTATPVPRPVAKARPAPPPRPVAKATPRNDDPPPDAVPRVERIPVTPNQPYVINGQPYVPLTSDVPVVESGIASWYGEPFHGRRTSTGEVYNMNAMTAAHKTMPLPSYAVVRNRRNGRQVVVRVNDRGPFVDGRIIDLSHAAARKLGIQGLGQVDVRRLTEADIRTGAWKVPGASTNVALGNAP